MFDDCPGCVRLEAECNGLREAYNNIRVLNLQIHDTLSAELSNLRSTLKTMVETEAALRDTLNSVRTDRDLAQAENYDLRKKLEKLTAP